ncbi:MAG: class I SAM-dependent methyltransferase [Actinobacteria bacterium]|nr:MAG: class I SAM-dependent methyltransferase [Actinomycetota bacterium]
MGDRWTGRLLGHPPVARGPGVAARNTHRRRWPGNRSLVDARGGDSVRPTAAPGRTATEAELRAQRLGRARPLSLLVPCSQRMSSRPNAASQPRSRDYAAQARTYDYTRGASPTVVRALAKHLGPAEGRLLLDVGGGTGNYAQVFQARGFRVLVVDPEFEMIVHAARKVGPGRSAVADARSLPLPDASVDRAILVNVLHVIEDRPAAARELRRVLRGGPVVIADPTSDNAPLFVHEYFGVAPPGNPRLSSDDIERILRDAGFRRVVHEPFVYTDGVDGSLPALHTDRFHLAGSAYLRNTSFWHHLDEETRRKGLEALAHDLRSGALERRVRENFELAVERGHGTVFAAWP